MNPADTNKAHGAISKARARLILDHPFFATLALRLTPTPTPWVETMGTDGRRLYFNPEWVNKLNTAELTGVVAHEAMHCALAHPLRTGNREHHKANIAQDHVINLLLLDAGFKLPKEGHANKAYAGMAWEQVYALLPDPPKQQQMIAMSIAGAEAAGVPLPDFGGMGCVIDATGDDGKPLGEADRDQGEREWKVALLQAAQTAKAQGKLPGSLEALADSVRAPQVDWRAVLREFVRTVAANDYSWKRPNARMLAAGDYLPSLWSETTGPILMGVDTSGSVSQSELDAVCSELNGCLDTARPESVHVVYCDAQVHGHEEFKPDDWPVRMAVKGRGGTHLAPIWPYAVEHDIDPVCAIITTDMELGTRDLGDDPGFPVLFLSTGRDAPMDGPLPFGTLVKIDAEARS